MADDGKAAPMSEDEHYILRALERRLRTAAPRWRVIETDFEAPEEPNVNQAFIIEQFPVSPDS